MRALVAYGGPGCPSTEEMIDRMLSHPRIQGQHVANQGALSKLGWLSRLQTELPTELALMLVIRDRQRLAGWSLGHPLVQLIRMAQEWTP